MRPGVRPFLLGPIVPINRPGGRRLAFFQPGAAGASGEGQGAEQDDLSDVDPRDLSFESQGSRASGGALGFKLDMLPKSVKIFAKVGVSVHMF